MDVLVVLLKGRLGTRQITQLAVYTRYTVYIISHRIHGTGIFTYTRLIFMLNVGKYTIHYMDPMGPSLKLTAKAPETKPTVSEKESRIVFQSHPFQEQICS